MATAWCSALVSLLSLSSLVLSTFPAAQALSIRPAAGGSLLEGKKHLRGSEPDNRTTSCAPLSNRGTFFTVKIEVGSPGQTFDVVADTGSDDVIVNSCLCAQVGHCDTANKCFTGAGRSSTFSVLNTPNGGALAMVLSFGSGQIKSVIATDVVRVGRVSTLMKNSLLLMVDRALSFSGPFEGILGLGVPRSDDGQDSPPLPFRPGQKPAFSGFEPQGFLSAAAVHRFSMCFNRDSDGALRLDTPPLQRPMGSIGQFHWGLDFRGISVGDTSTPVAICDPSNLGPGQETACGAIPDSGTTLIMGAAGHLQVLFTTLCDSWPRCKSAAGLHGMQKHELFQLLLMNCTSWMGDSGLSELPSLSFHVAGANGIEQTLEVGPDAYVFMTHQEEVKYVRRNLFGVFPVSIAVYTGREQTVCVPAFGSMSYNTVKNGPVWILGTPFFHSYVISYDLSSTPPSISFSNESCGSCAEGPALLSHGKTHGRRPREMHGPARMPSIDTTVPL